MVEMADSFKENLRGIRQLLKSGPVGDQLEDVAAPMVAHAKAQAATAPIQTGAYRDSVHAVLVQTPNGVEVRVVADVDYALEVEAKYGTLARAMDAR